MLALKNSALSLALMLFILAGSALTLSSVGVVYLGELDLLANINSTNSSLINSTLINSTAANNSTSIDVALALPQNLSASIGKEVLDLTSYARDRVNKSLAGYTNIMYPITGSRGTTASTSGGGGGGGGCGCG
ncbi:hypothetical protein [Methanothrix soehngenii]|uniref:hypothetical protein n=2 Tax=Methanothrix soehngenii TaxID=2223 RepID=UPI002B91839B|nr:hypothetical protein [Methanothrix soehngenii]HOS22162.1 hypothetical protein [Methanothrix soehngenii]HPL20550.1 hypothetical protein [Methanothrix soehngenii]